MVDFELVDKNGVEFTCDRYDLNYQYQLLLPFNAIKNAKCRVSPDIEAGYYTMKATNINGEFKKMYGA